jgi:hypothetical protein
MREKAWSMPLGTIHRRSEICQLGIQFVQDWLRKRPYTLSKSSRGSKDLQLSYSSLGPLLSQKLEENSVKRCQTV